MADCGCSLKLQKLLEMLTEHAIISLSEADAVWDADASDADVRCLDARLRSRSRTPRPMAQAPGGRSQTAGPSRQSSRTAPKRRASPVTQESDDGDHSPSPASRPNCININNHQASECAGKARWWVRRSSATRLAGGRWQYACDVCAEWFQVQRMIDQMEPLRKKDLEA